MTILYTGAQRWNESQLNSAISLGGWVSSTIVPNDVLGNIFGDVANQRETKVLCLRNDSNQALTNVNFWIEVGNSELFTYQIALAPVTIAAAGCVRTEQLSSSESSPYVGEFYSPTVDDKLVLTTFDANSYLTLFIRRTPITQAFSALNDCQALYDQYKQSQQQSTERIMNLKISW